MEYCCFHSLFNWTLFFILFQRNYLLIPNHETKTKWTENENAPPTPLHPNFGWRRLAHASPIFCKIWPIYSQRTHFGRVDFVTQKTKFTTQIDALLTISKIFVCLSLWLLFFLPNYIKQKKAMAWSKRLPRHARNIFLNCFSGYLSALGGDASVNYPRGNG